MTPPPGRYLVVVRLEGFVVRVSYPWSRRLRPARPASPNRPQSSKPSLSSSTACAASWAPAGIADTPLNNMTAPTAAPAAFDLIRIVFSSVAGPRHGGGVALPLTGQ